MDEDYEGAFVRWLVFERERQGLSRTALARKLQEAGLAWQPTQVTRLEEGQRGLRLNEAMVIARVLGTELSNVLELPLAVPMGDLLIHAVKDSLKAEAELVSAIDEWDFCQFMLIERSLGGESGSVTLDDLTGAGASDERRALMAHMLSEAERMRAMSWEDVGRAHLEARASEARQRLQDEDPQ